MLSAKVVLEVTFTFYCLTLLSKQKGRAKEPWVFLSDPPFAWKALELWKHFHKLQALFFLNVSYQYPTMLGP